MYVLRTTVKRSFCFPGVKNRARLLTSKAIGFEVFFLDSH
jgi:hypothetical protein